MFRTRGRECAPCWGHRPSTVDIAVGERGGTARPDAVRRDDGRVQQRQGDPDGGDDEDGGARGAVAGGAGAVHDRQVAHHGHGDQRVDRDVGGDSALTSSASPPSRSHRTN